MDRDPLLDAVDGEVCPTGLRGSDGELGVVSVDGCFEAVRRPPKRRVSSAPDHSNEAVGSFPSCEGVLQQGAVTGTNRPDRPRTARPWRARSGHRGRPLRAGSARTRTRLRDARAGPEGAIRDSRAHGRGRVLDAKSSSLPPCALAVGFVVELIVMASFFPASGSPGARRPIGSSPREAVLNPLGYLPGSRPASRTDLPTVRAGSATSTTT